MIVDDEIKLFDMQRKGVYAESGCASSLLAHEAKEGNDLICAVDCRNATESEVNGTLRAKESGGTSYNLNNVVRVKEDDFNAAGTQSPILRLLCKTYGAQAVVEWGIAVVAALQQTEVLRQGLHEESNACEAENRNKLDDCSLPCPSVVADWMLRDMREKSECGCSPQRQQSAEQRDQQSATAVPVLSLESTQRCEEMFDMWQKGQGIGLLRQALSEIQEIRQSSCCEKEQCRYIVRRLTPLEAERLQGYPDGWTDIGEWTDTKGKKHKPADSPRYKALGNSIAIPPWLFVLSRLNEYCEEKTMASLFDGIAGFPLIWEFLNGKGSAVWCSEIEEHPIAVTKQRFPDRQITIIFANDNIDRKEYDSLETAAIECGVTMTELLNIMNGKAKQHKEFFAAWSDEMDGDAE